MANQMLVIKHRNLEAARAELMFQLLHGQGFELIVLVGPSGAGKSTLMNKVVDIVHEHESAAMAAAPEYVPIVLTKAVAHGHRSFDWKRLYSDAATSAGDPFAYVRRPDGVPNRTPPRKRGEPASTAAFRWAMECEFEYRGTKYWIIDEAAHILSGTKSGGPGDQFDVLKSIAQIRKLKIVLVGSYDLASYIDCSAQLARRGSTIHLARYRIGERDDRRAFLSCVATILSHHGLSGHPDVKENLEFFYDGCTGCVGTLKDWIDRAVSFEKSSNNEPVLTIEALKATRLRTAALRTMWRETTRGEALLAPASDEEIRALETLAMAEVGRPAPNSGGASTSGVTKGKPGIRNPTRDPVGRLLSND